MRLTVVEFADQCEAIFRSAGMSMDAVMATLTFRAADCYDRGAVSDYVHRQRAWLQRRGIPHAYAWVLELQKRGVPHYHVLWFVPTGQKLPMPDRIAKRQRRAFWPHGLSRIELARRGPAYITKYASKGDVYDAEGDRRSIPRGARIFGVGGEPQARRHAYWRAQPAYVREATTPGDVIRRAPGGGFFVVDTGIWIPSQWELITEPIADGRWRTTLRKKLGALPAIGGSEPQGSGVPS
jgi:hypothetical protein